MKEPKGLSDRIQWLRDYYFSGNDRAWNNEYTSWTTGTPWDIVYNELTFYIVPETYTLINTLGASYLQAARPVVLHPDFWKWPRVQRRAWFVRKPLSITYRRKFCRAICWRAPDSIFRHPCVYERGKRSVAAEVKGKNGARAKMKWFHDHGYGNAGATSGHLVPGHDERC